MNLDEVEAIIRGVAERPDLVDQFIDQYREQQPDPPTNPSVWDYPFTGFFVLASPLIGVIQVGGALLNYPWNHQSPIILAGYLLLGIALNICAAAIAALILAKS